MKKVNKIPGTGLFNDEIDVLTTSTDTTVLTEAEKAAIAKSKKAQAEAAAVS